MCPHRCSGFSTVRRKYKPPTVIALCFDVTNGHMESFFYEEPVPQIDVKRDRQTDRQTDRKKQRQRQTERDTDTDTHTEASYLGPEDLETEPDQRKIRQACVVILI